MLILSCADVIVVLVRLCGFGFWVVFCFLIVRRCCVIVSVVVRCAVVVVS